MFLWLTVIYLLWASFGLYWKGWGLWASRHGLNSSHGSTSGPGLWLRAHPIALRKLLVCRACLQLCWAGWWFANAERSQSTLAAFPTQTYIPAGRRRAGWAGQRSSAPGDPKRGCYCFSLLEQNRAARAQAASSQSSSIRNLTDYMYYRLRNNYIPNINIIQL